MDFDINVLMNLLEFLPYKDLVSICSSKKNLYRLCKKHEDTIWERMLLRDYGIHRNEIIGKTKSYYIGLQGNIGTEYTVKYDVDWSHPYDGGDFRRYLVKFHNEQYSYRNLTFLVPNAEKTNLKGEQIWLGKYQLVSSLPREEPLFFTVVAKTLPLCIKFMEKKLQEKLRDGFEYIRGLKGENLTNHETIYQVSHGRDVLSIGYGFYQITL